jgi:hypothetical protein
MRRSGLSQLTLSAPISCGLIPLPRVDCGSLSPSNCGPNAVIVVILSSVAAVLLAAILLKLVAIANALRWAGTHARAYTVAFKANPPKTPAESIALLQAHGTAFFPFGIKDFRLRRFNEPHVGDSARVRRLRGTCRVMSFWLFNARRLVWLSITTCLIANIALPRSQSLVHWLALATSTLSAALVIEALVWYVTAQAYAQPFHMLGFGVGSRPGRSVRVDEAYVFFRLTAFAALTCIIACSTVQRQVGGFDGATTRGGLPGELIRLGRFFYFVLTNLTTTGGANIDPISGEASFLTGLVQLQTLLIFVFALTVAGSMLSSRDDG